MEGVEKIINKIDKLLTSTIRKKVIGQIKIRRKIPRYKKNVEKNELPFTRYKLVIIIYKDFFFENFLKISNNQFWREKMFNINSIF